jgi:ubiquinone/menaquinone biosynthesis C-methylase UbiE
MNRRHSRLTDWGLSHVSVREHDTILDIGCGGGKTVAKLAAAASKGVVHGVDYAAASVAAAQRTNRALVTIGRVVIQQASASDLPYPDSTFELVTAVETHFWWTDLAAGMREALRVLKAGGHMAVIAEFYNGGKHVRYAARLGAWTSMAILDVEQHRAMLTDAGFVDVLIDEEASRGWICCIAQKAE